MMRLLQILLLWISGFLSLSQGQSGSCLPDYDGVCPEGRLVEDDQCVSILPMKENYHKAKRQCRTIGGRLLSVDDLEKDSVRGCLKSMHPHHKFKMIWVDGRYVCSLYDLSKQSSRDPGCKKKRFFACISDAVPETTTEAETTTPQPTTTTTTTTTTTMSTTTTTTPTPPRPTTSTQDEEEETDSDTAAPTGPMTDEETTQWGDEGEQSTPQSVPTGGQSSMPGDTDTDQPHPEPSTGDSGSSDPHVTTYILTLSENASTDKPGGSGSATTMSKPTGGDTSRDDADKMPPAEASQTPSEDGESSSAPSGSPDKPALSSQCVYPAKLAVCPQDWRAISDSLCLSIVWNARVTQTAASESCVMQGGELLKENQLDENIANCLRETTARDYADTRIFRLAEEKCLAYNLPGDELSTCDTESSFAYICAIHQGDTDGGSMDAAPIAGITLGVTGVAILVYHTLKLRN